MDNSHKYDDIINLPHHVSEKRARMSMLDRGAQFSPFAALVGYDAAIAETARLTDFRIELTDSAKQALNETLRRVTENIRQHPQVSVLGSCPMNGRPGAAMSAARAR